MNARDEALTRVVTWGGYLALGCFLLFVVGLLIKHTSVVSTPSHENSDSSVAVREPTHSRRRKHHSKEKYAHSDKEVSHRDSDDSEND